MTSTQEKNHNNDQDTNAVHKHAHLTSNFSIMIEVLKQVSFFFFF